MNFKKSMFFLISTLTICSSLANSAELKETSEILNCSECHNNQTVLPNEHVDIYRFDNCNACHKISESFSPEKHSSLRGKISLMHTHLLSKVSCDDCHANNNKYPSNETCFKCHESYDSLAKETSFLGQMNPHSSPHYGATLTCDTCHYIHSKSEDLCLECHNTFRPMP